MPFPSKPLGEWVREDLDALIADPPAVENARLDFKADCKVLSGDKVEKDKARGDILKDIAAMANGAGGVLLIGVRQTGNPADPPFAAKIEGVIDVERLRKAIDDLVTTHLDVRPARLEYYTIPCQDGLSVLGISVPANTYCLSMVTYGNLNQFWIRRGTDNRPMRTDEIEYKFGEFAKVNESASAELAAIRERLKALFKEPFVWFAGVPLSRQRDHVPVRMRDISELIRNSSYLKAFPDHAGVSGRYLATYLESLAPSIRGLAIKPEFREFRTLDIQRDGVVVFGDTAACEEPQTLFVQSVYEVWLSGLHLFFDLQASYNLGRAAVVQAGLLFAKGKIVTNYRLRPGYPSVSVNELEMDALMLDEHWRPAEVFWQWAVQFGNELGREEPVPCSPWTDRNAAKR